MGNHACRCNYVTCKRTDALHQCRCNPVDSVRALSEAMTEPDGTAHRFAVNVRGSRHRVRECTFIKVTHDAQLNMVAIGHRVLFANVPIDGTGKRALTCEIDLHVGHLIVLISGALAVNAPAFTWTGNTTNYSLYRELLLVGERCWWNGTAHTTSPGLRNGVYFLKGRCAYLSLVFADRGQVRMHDVSVVMDGDPEFEDLEAIIARPGRALPSNLTLRRLLPFQ